MPGLWRQGRKRGDQVNSSWIDSTLYKSFPDGSSYLAVFLKDHEKACGSCGGRGYVPADPSSRLRDRACQDCQREGTVQAPPTALLYGPKVPSYLPGLVAAGTGRRSVGLAFNRLVKSKYTYQRVEGKEQVKKLKEMLK